MHFSFIYFCMYNYAVSCLPFNQRQKFYLAKVLAILLITIIQNTRVVVWVNFDFDTQCLLVLLVDGFLINSSGST